MNLSYRYTADVVIEIRAVNMAIEIRAVGWVVKDGSIEILVSRKKEKINKRG